VTVSSSVCAQDTPYPHTYTHMHLLLWRIVSMFCVFQIYCHLQHFVAGAGHRLSRRLEPNMHQRQPQYDLSPTYRYMIAVCMFVNGCGNFIDNVCHCLCLCLPACLSVAATVKGTFLITLFTRKLNGNMSSLIKLFSFRYLFVLSVAVLCAPCLW